MKKLDVVIALESVRDARAKWLTAQTKFNADVEAVLRRLIHEAAANFMSAEEVAKSSGLTVKRVRMLMRSAGMDPKAGKRLLSKQASTALSTNAELLGIEPHEMDLTSPLAYLPMGDEMRKELRAQAASQVHEVSGNSYDDAKDRIEKALYLGIDAEEVPVSRGNVPEIAAWLASEGVK